MDTKTQKNKDLTLMITIFAVAAVVLIMAIVSTVVAIVIGTSRFVEGVHMFEHPSELKEMMPYSMKGGTEYIDTRFDMFKGFFAREQAAASYCDIKEGGRYALSGVYSQGSACICAYSFETDDDAYLYYEIITDDENAYFSSYANFASVGVTEWTVNNGKGTEYHYVVRKENNVYHICANEEAIFEAIKAAVEAICAE
jgi:hypothetical protein